MTDTATPVNGAWRSRITGSGEEDPTQLVANPRNWRIHPKGQQDALGSVLDEVGWVQQVLVNRTTGNVVDGHLRVELALSKNEATVPVLYVELTEAEEALVLASLDPLSAMAASDESKLRELLTDISVDKDELMAQLGLSVQRVEFPEYDETAADEVVFNECPECGHKWPA